MRVLVTRPKIDADETARLLKARGHIPLVAPLMEIRFRDGPEISLPGIQAILATSSNGVAALARRTSGRDVPLFAVGPRTASVARDAGFQTVKMADGDALALAGAARDWAQPGNGALLHAAGAETKGELAMQLLRDGFDVRTIILYDAVAVTELPVACKSALESDALDAVLMFSPRSSRIFSDCVVKAGLSEKCGRLIGCFISQAAADSVSPLEFRAVRVAESPNQDAMLRLLD
jgi:uroporphyrinogen-III synthase